MLKFPFSKSLQMVENKHNNEVAIIRKEKGEQFFTGNGYNN